MQQTVAIGIGVGVLSVFILLAFHAFTDVYATVSGLINFGITLM